MEEQTKIHPGHRRLRDRVFGFVGALGLLLPLIYYAQLRVDSLITPWYLPVLGTMALVGCAVSLRYKQNFWRWWGTGLLGALAAVEWVFLVTTHLPSYSGVMKVGEPFPDFITTLAAGTPVARSTILAGGKTAIVFFRGKW